MNDYLRTPEKQDISTNSKSLLTDSAAGLILPVSNLEGHAEIGQVLREGYELWKSQTAQHAPLQRSLLLLSPDEEVPENALCTLPILTQSGDCVGVLALVKPLPSLDAPTLLRGLGLSFCGACFLAAERKPHRNPVLQKQQSDNETKKRDVLFQAAKKLHSITDVDGVLEEMVESIRSVFPSVQVNLLLSQDNHASKLPVKPLSFQNPEGDICTRAFMEGQLIYEPRSREHERTVSSVAAPLSGKQGVYGVLHIQSEKDAFDATDIRFITMLADTAGSAFENAKLYEQSNRLITELRLINEITKRLNQSLSLNEIFTFASTELVKIFRADYCCILQADVPNQQFIVRAGNLPAMFHERLELDYGYSGIVYSTKEPVIISDYLTRRKVQSKMMEMANARSLIASPITVNGEVIGVIHITHHRPNYFSYENFKLLQVLSVHVGLAMSNASLHAEVKRMVITDRLTSLYARHFLDEQVNLLQKKDYCGSLILVDIDHFKRVNDTFGHQVGDKILIQVSNIIKSSIRDTDIAARWGGEELAIYLPLVARDQTVRIAERIRSRVMNETDPQVTVSCGVSDWNWEDEKISVESLVYRADMALYEAKHAGRNQVKLG